MGQRLAVGSIEGKEMAGQYEVEVTVVSGKNLKNVNWKNGDLRPYAVLWVDPAAKCSTKVAANGENSGEDPLWEEKITVPMVRGGSVGDAVLYVDVVHADAGQDAKLLVGSARVSLSEIVDEVGLGMKQTRTIKLKRPSGRPHGKIEVEIAVKEPARYYEAAPPLPPPYGHQSYGAPYGAAPPSAYPAYGYGSPAPMAGYQQAPPVYGQQPYAGAGEEKKSKYGMGTGLAVGAAAGVLGGLALAEGVDYVEDEIANDVEEKVEDDLGYDDDDF